MKHIIVGTAGHIDHGKTSLIRALTGRNTDRLEEEKKRGISIELGFTYFDLPSGQRAGIIDVPGHEKFVKNMLAGVIGIDIVILIVAADEGIMPQTLEHLAILDLLGIKKGFIAMTKIDMVDEDWMDLVEEEIREEVRGTFLEDSPIIRASSVTKQGLEDVINLLEEYTEEMEDINSDELPRLPVDRAFTISGFGTIVTGTLLSGKLNIGDEVQIYPSQNTARIRSIQVHDRDSDMAYAGQRVAVNLAGVKKEDVDRGHVIAPIGSMEGTMMLDAKVRLLKSFDKAIKNRTRVRLYIGTKEVLCRMVLLDREELKPGEEAFVQLRLEEEVVAKMKDRFIIRFYSPMFTIGGGEVLDSNPKKKKRYDEKTLKELEIKDKGSSKDIIERIIESKSRDFPSIRDIMSYTSLSEEGLMEEIRELATDKRVVLFSLTKDIYVIHNSYYDYLRDSIMKELEDYHRKYPLRSGIAKEEIRSKFLKNVKPRVGEIFIEGLVKEGHLERDNENLKLSGFEISYDEEQSSIKTNILKILGEISALPPKRDELCEMLKVQQEIFNEVFNSLVNTGEIIKLNEELFIGKEYYNRALEKLREYILKNGSVSVAEYRDLLNINRKLSLALLEYFDQNKITKREIDKRVLNKD
ncbi:selenocysteine-specific translation elongation factor [Tissierellaceae bacterium HCP3S3_D8]